MKMVSSFAKRQYFLLALYAVLNLLTTGLVAQTTVVNYNFDSSLDGWSVGGTINGMSWLNGTAILSAGNATNYLHTTPSPYPSSAGAHITSPALDFTGYESMTLSVDVSCDTEGGFDGVTMFYSLDGGSTWSQLGSQGGSWFPDVGIDGPNDQYTEITSDPDGWDGARTVWTTYSLVLPASPFDGASGVLFRMYFGSDGSVTEVGAAFDNFIIEGTLLCVAPTASFTTDDSSCGAGSFAVTVNLTDMGDADAIIITDDQGGTFNNGGAGYTLGDFPVTVGTYTAGTNVVMTVDDDNVSCPVSSPTLTEDCACAISPSATVADANRDCGAGTFDIQVTVTSDGSGDANMTDILIDGVVVQVDATTNTMYSFSRPVGSYTVTAAAEGSTFVSCTSVDYAISTVCTNLTCADAFNIPLDGTGVTTSPIPNSSTSYVGTSCDASGNEETWFQFTAPASGLVVLTIDNYDDPFDNLDWAVFSGACGSLTEVTCGSGNGAAPVSGEVLSGLTGGTTYYLQTSQDFGSGATFDASLTNPITAINANTQTCWDLANGTLLFDLGDGGDDYDCGFGFLYSSSGRGQLAYTYTPASNETVDIVVDNVVATNDFAVAIFDNTVGTPVTCLDGNESNTDFTLANLSLVGGTTYIIIIGEEGTTDDPTGCLTINQQCNTVYTTTINNNCAAMSYDAVINFSSLGGVASMVSISDGITTYNNISTGVDYTFSYTDVANHDIVVMGSSNSCEEVITVNSGCNGTDICAGAPDITNSCSPGDLTMAAVDGGALVQNFISCGNGTTIALCGANGTFTGTSYVRTDHRDIWYAVTPNGADELTITISDLVGGSIMVLPYLSSNGTCPTLSSANDLLEDHIGNLSQSITNGNCPFFTINGSLTLSGAALTTATTVYLRVMPYAENGSGATNCETLTYPTFTICTSVPQANDVCGDAIDMDGVTAAGDLCAANTETENTETGAACAESQDTPDLWYEVTMDAADSDQFLEVDLTFPNATDAVVVELYSNCFSSTFEECATVSSTGMGSTVSHAFMSTITAGGGGGTWYVRVTPVAGNGVCDFTIQGNRVAENNNCEVMQTSFPGFDIEGPALTGMNFDFASPSGAIPAIAGNDLWFQFNTNQATDPATGLITGSTTSEVIIFGDPGVEYTLVLYKGNTVSGNNCTDLAGDFLETLVVTPNGSTTVEFSCLDELHLSTDGGYILRVIQTGGPTSTNGGVRTETQPAGPYNNDCVNIWDGSGASILGANGEDASTNFNPYVILPGFSNYRSGDFENATDCNPSIASALCNGVDQQAIASNEDRDLWYVITIPTLSGICDLSVSEVINGVTFLYNAGSQTEDGILYLYDGCDDTNLIDCSGVLDGAPSGAGDAQFDDPQSTWTVNGLTQGASYLLRVKPDDISNNANNNEFDFDISWRTTPPAPCNDDPANAESLSVGCFDYASLETWSAQGATETTPIDGAPETDVWFSFVAPDNGGNYTSAGSWVTVFFENVSGHQLSLDIYDTTSTDPAGRTWISGSSSGDQGWGVFGNLNPGQTYYLRLYHKELPTVNVQYKIAVNDGPAEEPGWGCGENSESNISGCASGCNDLREVFFKIDLPDGTPGNAYWSVEVTGIDQDLDFELRSKYLNGNTTYVTGITGVDGALEGGAMDFDHPCSSVALEAAVSLSSTTTGLTGCDGNDSLGDIDPTTTSQASDGNTDAGSGVRRIYFNMNGAVPGQKDYYFLRVFIDPSDPRYTDWAEVKICDISFNGPYSTEALADAGGVPDLQCLSCDISDVQLTSDGICNANNAEFTLNFDVATGSGDYEVFATADNATYGITTGDVLGTITTAGATGTDLAITGTIINPSIASSISVNVRDTNDPAGCLGGGAVIINVPACSVAPSCTAVADAPSGTNITFCNGGGALTATDATPDAGQTDYTVLYLLADSGNTIVDNASSLVALTAPANPGTTAEIYTVYTLEYEAAQGVSIVNNTTTLTSIMDSGGDIIGATPSSTACMDLSDGGVIVTVNNLPTATVATSSLVCNVATATGNDEGQLDLDALVTAGDITGTWTIESGNDGNTATITGSMAGGDVIFDAGSETGPFNLRYTLAALPPCTDQAYDLTVTRIECGVCAPEVGISRDRN